MKSQWPDARFEDTPYAARDVAVVGNLAYVADSSSGLRVIDVSNLAFPIELGAFDTQGTLSPRLRVSVRQATTSVARPGGPDLQSSSLYPNALARLRGVALDP